VAAIDCGTNSLRLLIADVDPGRGELADVDRRMEIVRLGQGVDATGRLAPEALERTFRVLADYARAISAAGAGRARMVATSATRDASNASEFVQGVTQILGVAPEVISGDEEAALSFTGATAELGQPDPADGGLQPPFLVVDIGGGSTELVLGSGATAGSTTAGSTTAGSTTAGSTTAGGSQRLAAASMNIGCVRLTERHLHADPPQTAEIQAAADDIDAALAKVAASVPAASARTLIGLAGSVTTVTGIALDLPAYDPARIHHARISASLVHEVTVSLLGQTRQQRAAIGVMHPGRVDVIGAGALILDRIMNRFSFAEMVASEHDILDGIAWSIVAGGRQPSRR
jgi:exopolyphosphatase/guanosine-5'-triphosphate,3'-diphosphate pyrophosphatase